MEAKAQKFTLKLVKEETSQYKLDYKVNNPEVAYRAFIDILELDCQAEEVFGILTLDIKSKITGVFEVSRGSISKSVVSPREVFKRAILNNACGIILGHNHPSGELTPSSEDKSITEKLKKAGDLIGITILDHLIIGDNNYISLRERGYLSWSVISAAIISGLKILI